MTTDWNLVRKLKLLGFEENEARVYLVALELGPASMWEIHQKCGIKRTTCYQIFDGFVERGIAMKTPELKHVIYSVVAPESLIVSLEQKKNQFRDALPLFDAVMSNSSVKPEISLYKGLEGVRQVYNQGLQSPEGSEILLLATPRLWLGNPDENNAYIKERLKKKISLRMIFPDEKANYALLTSDKKELRKTRFLPKEIYDPPVEIQIFQNKVAYIAHSEREPFATVIENTAIAESEKQIFELLWGIAKEKH